MPKKRDWPKMPTGRRARGELEHAVDRWCKIWLIDAMEADCTPAWIANQIVATEKRPTSISAVRRTLECWDRIGYANVGEGPLRFISLTPDGMRLGYEELHWRAGHGRRMSRPATGGGMR